MLVAINNTDLWIRACFIKFFLPLFVRYHGGQNATDNLLYWTLKFLHMWGA